MDDRPDGKPHTHFLEVGRLIGLSKIFRFALPVFGEQAQSGRQFYLSMIEGRELIE